jgi:DNA-binding MarR family transcriptional regulator
MPARIGWAGSTLARLHLAGDCTVSELAAAMGLEVSSMSRRIQSLEAAGLIQREIGATDRRTAHLRLSRQGRIVVERLQAGWRQMLDEVTAGWTEADIATFAVLFGRFADDFETYAASSVKKPSPRRSVPAGRG